MNASGIHGHHRSLERLSATVSISRKQIFSNPARKAPNDCHQHEMCYHQRYTITSILKSSWASFKEDSGMSPFATRVLDIKYHKGV